MAEPSQAKAGGLSSFLRSGDVGSLLTHHSDIALALLVVLSVAMMIVPLPPVLLDLCITLNMAAAVVLLLVAVYVGNALRIATFPSLLLLTTLFRLAIEISATRLILLNANAGTVIAAFGGYVVAGNLIVGVVVFAILTMVQYIVIAKGSARVAEVAARFTLDALPGRQLAIDSELRAGHIDDRQARQRRAQLARESQFFGSMDGAMRFVRGDAVAGIVVLLVNIVGGLLVGVLQRGMDIGSALRTYTLLTVGEGLVAQIPALIISTAAGILVTRVSSEEEGGHLGSDIGRQILAQPKALAVAAALLAVLATVPGLPALPFLLLGVLFGVLAYNLLRTRARQDPAARVAASPATPLRVAVDVELGAALAGTLMPARGPSLFLSKWLPGVRERIFSESGIPLPAIDVRVAGDQADGYAIRLHEIPVATGSIADLGQRDEAVAKAGETIALHLHRVLRQHGHRLVGVEETQTLLDNLERTHPALVHEVVPRLATPVLLADVLQRLARESISLRHLADILTAVARRAPGKDDAAAVAEHVRKALQRQITFQHSGPDGKVAVFIVDPLIEETLREAIRHGEDGSHLALEPHLAADIGQAVACAVSGLARPVLLTSSDIRRHLHGLLAHEHPELSVLAHQELLPEATLHTLGHISIEQAEAPSSAAPSTADRAHVSASGHRPTPPQAGR